MVFVQSFLVLAYIDKDHGRFIFILVTLFLTTTPFDDESSMVSVKRPLEVVCANSFVALVWNAVLLPPHEFLLPLGHCSDDL